MAQTTPATSTQPKSRPNIVLILADDMGFSDLGCYGSEISTPNLDRLGTQGLRFTQFYNTARCCPSRAALLTGLYPHQTGVGHMVGDDHVPGYRGFLNERCVTIAEALRPAGYRTLISGKWHIGEDRPHWPVDRGFDRSFGLISGASSYWKLDEGRQMTLDGEPYTPPQDGFYMTDAFTDYALQFLDEHQGQHREQPFFLYLPYTAPHWPLHAHPQDIAKYRGKYKAGWDELRRKRHAALIEKGLVDAKWPLSPRDPRAPRWDEVKDKDAEDLNMAVYAAQLERMDTGIGRVMDKLRAMGAEENTLVVFLADNGGCAEEINRGKPGVPPGPVDSFLSYGLPWSNASNTPFRRHKSWVHEGGIASPMIAYWPAAIAKGGISREVSHNIDLMPTILEAAGVTYPRTFKEQEITPVEGKSLLPVFRGQTRDGHKALFWEHQGNRAVRAGNWKLVAAHNAPWELYDMQADRNELNDLAQAQPEKVRELEALYNQWAERAGVVPFSQIQALRRKAKSPQSAPNTNKAE